MAALPPGVRLQRTRQFFGSLLCVAGVVCGGLPDRSSLAAGAAGGAQRPRTAEVRAPRRIISLIPAITEMLFAMRAQDRLIAVSAYDRFPPEVNRFPHVGGLLDPNVERILALKPDLVIVYDTQASLRSQLDRAGIETFLYAHRGLSDITATMRALGRRIGSAAEAGRAAAAIEAQLGDLRRRVAGQPRPRTLLVFGREPGSLRGIDASGGFGFLHDVLELAGGSDVLGDFERQSVQLGTETILARAPEVIIELHYGDSAGRLNPEAETGAWNALPSVPAVRNKRIHLLVGDEFVVPGPRIVQAAERFARVLHPAVFR
jgi:iron complex transport system substrate-binding protein